MTEHISENKPPPSDSEPPLPHLTGEKERRPRPDLLATRPWAVMAVYLCFPILTVLLSLQTFRSASKMAASLKRTLYLTAGTLEIVVSIVTLIIAVVLFRQLSGQRKGSGDA